MTIFYARLKTLALVGLLSGSLMISTPVSAMDFMGNAAQFNAMSINAGYAILSKNTLSYYDGSRKKGKKTTTKATNSQKTTNQKSTAKTATASAVTHNASYYRFKSNNAITNQITNEVINGLRQTLKQQGKLDANAEVVLGKLANGNMIGQLKKSLKADGYDPNSLATAMATWIVTNYGIATDSLSANLQGHGLVKQLEETMGSSDSVLIGKSDAEKQQIADALYMMSMLSIAAYMDSTDNRQNLNSIKSQAKSALSNLGLSTSMLTNRSGQVKIL